MTAPSLELIGFTKRFGAMAALDDVSVKVTGPPSEPDVAIVVVYVGELVVATVPVVVAALSVPLVTKSV